MDNFKQECKLCDNIISDKNCKVIDVAKEIFDILLMKLTLNETQNVMCMTCSSKLMAALSFKTKCLSTDNTIVPYVDFKNPKPVDIKEIYAKEKGNKQGGRSLDDRDVCRLCLEPVSGDHKSIQEVPVGSIEIYIPEINFEATTNPVICINCHDALHVHSTFIKNCLDVDRKRNGDAMNGEERLYNVESIKTEEIQIKSEEIDEDILFDINKAEHDEGDTHVEESKSLYELDQRDQASAQSTFANNQSEECCFKTTSRRLSADHEQRPKRALATKVTKSDGSKRNSKGRCLTRGLKVQEYQCDNLYNTKHKGHLNQHQLIHKDLSEVRVFKCDQCKFTTNCKGTLIRHQLKHKDPSEVRMFKCDECDYKSIQKGNLKLHLLRHKDPSEVRVFQCDECDYKSIQKGNLKLHLLTHKDPSEVLMLQCDECDYKTIQKSNLKLHLLTHKDPSEVLMFQCDECDYKSIQKAHLKQHLLRHKDPSEVRVFQCDECDYKSIRKGSLLRHQLIHKDPSEVKVFKCDKCKFETNHKNSLIKHCLKHKDPAEVRVFQCDECDYKSIQEGDLKRHQLRHKDPLEMGVFECDECDYKSIQKGNLKQHQLTHKCTFETKFKGNLKKHCLTHNGDAMNNQEIFLNDNQSIKMEVKCEETDERLFEILCDINKEEHNEGDTTDLWHCDESKSVRT